jgi:hypothetical protein
MKLICCVGECENNAISFSTDEGYKDEFDNHARFFYCEKHKPIRILRCLVDEYPKYFKGK